MGGAVRSTQSMNADSSVNWRAGLCRRSWPMVDCRSQMLAPQGEPAPWAGYSGTASGSGAKAVRSERNSALANPGVWAAPSRSGRPTESAKRKSPLKKPRGFPFSVAR